MSLTFGFEAEFATGVDELTRSLFREGLVGSDNRHSYHCRCEHCQFYPPADRELTEDWFPFRVQSDSSCDGEVISSIFTLDDLHYLDDLERLAVEADAEPGMVAGFHVHVGIPPDVTASYEHKARIGLQFCRFEELLTNIAGGAMVDMRNFNRSMSAFAGFPRVQDRILNHLEDRGMDFEFQPLSRATDTINHLYRQHPNIVADFLSAAFEGVDRHSTWTMVTSSGRTTEFRLWNSTRAAWRMELFIRLSLFMSNPDVLTDLESLNTADGGDFMALLSLHDETCHGLAQRQLDYANNHEPVLVFS